MHIFVRLHKLFFWFSTIFIAILTAAITIYTFAIFVGKVTLREMLTIYFIPSFILLSLIATTIKFEKLGGILFTGVSFGFLFIYHLPISITIFFLLFISGLLFLVDNYYSNTKEKIQ